MYEIKIWGGGKTERTCSLHPLQNESVNVNVQLLEEFLTSSTDVEIYLLNVYKPSKLML